MGDVLHRCQRCGEIFPLSEFVQPSARRCAACGSDAVELAQPAASAPRLGLAAKPGESPAQEAMPAPDTDAPAVVAGAGREAARRSLEKLPPSPLWISLLVLFVYTVPLAVLLWGAIEGLTWGRLWILVRAYALLLPWLLITVEAFREGFLYSLGCLIVPGYVVVYSLRRVERAWMRYLILGALFLMTAEYLWWHDQSVVVAISRRSDAFIERVAQELRRSARSD